MKIIAITRPHFVDGEAVFIKKLFEKGLDILHLRKPLCDNNRDVTTTRIRLLLKELSANERKNIIIHDYHEFYEEFSLKGVHINKNIKTLPIDYQGFKTRSCHSLEEVVSYKNDFDYVFLSPVFDSISKESYRSKFSRETLEKASRGGIIDEKVVALGGVDFENIHCLKELGFGGVAMLGSINKLTSDELEGLDLRRYKQ